MSLSSILRNRAVALALVISGVTSGAAIGSVVLHTTEPTRTLHAPTLPDAGANALLREHGCWAGAAPADMKGKLPGHVVVTTAQDRTVYAGVRMVGKALDQQFGGKHYGLTVWGFCR